MPSFFSPQLVPPGLQCLSPSRCVSPFAGVRPTFHLDHTKPWFPESPQCFRLASSLNLGDLQLSFPEVPDSSGFPALPFFSLEPFLPFSKQCRPPFSPTEIVWIYPTLPPFFGHFLPLGTDVAHPSCIGSPSRNFPEINQHARQIPFPSLPILFN